MKKFNFAKNKNILLQILKDIYTDSSIAPYLGFKGGTAALLFYGLDRDSVDIDLDLLEEEKESLVFEKVNKIVSKYGTVDSSRIKKFTLLNIISYEQGAPKIKVEINRRQFGSKYELKTLLGISMLVMVQEDMFAHKLMAMHERIGKTSRDIYDVWFFLESRWPINREIIEQRSGMTYKEALRVVAEQMESFDNKHILDGLGDFLSESQKDWARAKLRTETIFLLKARVESE